ncbi:MAG: hypothetical protein HY879_02025 [Deltaproteobacteria bacterium]|nr:hypothetical protein [Deltaproteobacteria bacterium]
MKALSIALSGVLLVFSLLIGCVAYVPGPPPDGVYVPGPPPEPLVDVRPVIPYPDSVWIGGYWGYHGGNWNWRRGYWDRRPHPGAEWHPGRWHHHGPRGWGWRPGYWR